MNIESVMNTAVRTIDKKTSIVVAAKTMDEARVGFLPVLDGAGKPIGALTDRDIALRCVAEGIPSSAPVAEAMTPLGHCVRADQDLGEALELMKDYKIARIMVTDQLGALVGIVSLDDAAVAFPGDRRIAEIHEALRSRTLTPALPS